jgi:hypothetical protein
MSKISPRPFVPADIPPSDPAVRYSYGFNISGTNQPEVLQVVGAPDGPKSTFVIMRGISAAKAQAIAMILNAPEA